MWISPETIELFPTPVQGVLETNVSPHHAGRVKAIASSWPAELYYSGVVAIAAGDPVLVIGRRGITLLVTPESF